MIVLNEGEKNDVMVAANILRTMAKAGARREGGTGICHNLSTQLMKKDICVGWSIDRLLRQAFQAWPKFSGDSAYPVPGGHDVYWDTERKWAGKQGLLRKELCTFCAEYIESAINSTESVEKEMTND